MFFVCREIYRFQESSRDKTVGMDCLLLLDKAEVPEGIDDLSVRIVRVSSMVMRKLSGVQSTESIEAIALMSIPTSFFNVVDGQEKADCQRWFPSPHRILVLDGIQVIITLILSSCHYWEAVYGFSSIVVALHFYFFFGCKKMISCNSLLFGVIMDAALVFCSVEIQI